MELPQSHLNLLPDREKERERERGRGLLRTAFLLPLLTSLCIVRRDRVPRGSEGCRRDKFPPVSRLPRLWSRWHRSTEPVCLRNPASKSVRKRQSKGRGETEKRPWSRYSWSRLRDPARRWPSPPAVCSPPTRPAGTPPCPHPPSPRRSSQLLDSTRSSAAGKTRPRTHAHVQYDFGIGPVRHSTASVDVCLER